MIKLRSKHLICGLLASSALVQPALAQDAGTETMPPQRQMLDENGVNVATGQQVSYVTDLSIGPDDAGGLRLVRGRGHGAASSNYVYALNGDPNVSLGVAAGQRYITFNKVGGVFVPIDGSGATIVQNSSTMFTLTLESGTVIVYNQQSTHDTSIARGTDVTFANGQKLTLSYSLASWCTDFLDTCGGYAYATRLEAVSSSLGYQLHYNYAREDLPTTNGQSFNWKQLASIQAINTRIDPCDPYAVSCTTTQSWPTVSYDTTGGVTDPVGNKTVYTDSTTQFKIRRPSSATDNIIINNDANQRTTSVVRDGMTWTYNWALAGNVMTMTRTDPLNHVRTIVSDVTVGLPTSITNELTRVTTNQYDTSGRLTKTTFPEGNYVQYTYDGRGNVTQVKRVAKSGTGLPDIITSASYPASCSSASCNRPTTTTDARGNVTDYTYTTAGDVATVTSPAPTVGGIRPQVRYTYADVSTVGGLVPKLQTVSQCQTQSTCAGTADETKATLAWSIQLALTDITRANGTGTLSATTHITYDNVGNPITIDGPLSGTADTTTLRYDNARRLVGQISPDPDGLGSLSRRAVKTTYHPDGGVQKIETGTVNGTADTDWAAIAVLQTQTIGYDIASRPATVSIAGSDGIVQALAQQSYDAEDRQDCFAIRMNSATFSSPPVACALGVEGSFGKDRITKTLYDNADHVIQQQVAFGTASQANERTLAYTNNGQLQMLTDAENNKTTYVYDGHDRLSKTSMPNLNKGAGTSSVSDDEILTYETTSSGTRTSGTVASRQLRDDQIIGYTYDNLGRVTLKNLPGSEPDVTYVYDNLSRPTNISQPGNALTLGYDALGRQTSDGQAWGAITRSYDLAGRMTRTTWSDGFYVDYDRLVTGELNKVRENGVTSGVGVLATYGYDSLGRRTSITRGNGAVTNYGYDLVSRLTSLTQNLTGTANDLTIGTMTYNPAGQIIGQPRSTDAYSWNAAAALNRNYTSNGLNQYTASGNDLPTYDGRGNLTKAISVIYTYSSENRLTSTSDGISIYYDPIGRISEYDTTSSLRFINDGTEIAAEIDASSGNILRRYVRGDGDDEVLVWYEGAGTADRRWLHSDERGSIAALSDSSGNLMPGGASNYDEFGIPGTANVGRFQYTGQAWLPELGMYYYKARVYSPSLGRFLQADPIGYGDGMNMYAYVGNDPIDFVDPMGLSMAPPPPCPNDGMPCTTVTAPCRWTTTCWIPRGPGSIVIGPHSGSMLRVGGASSSTAGKQAAPPQNEDCTSARDNIGSTVVDRVGDAHGSIFAAGAASASRAGNEVGAQAIGRAALPGAVLLGGVSEGIAAADDHAHGMSVGRSAAIHGTGFAGGLLGGFLLGEAVEPLGGGIVGAVIAGIAGSYGGSKAGEAMGAAGATQLGVCK